jgi:alkanesulfonate monooxygenase SsuD/methylene tetrahydromethanopterin reductase-like flavin-dependent oxidoreductase (luciferase family)
VSPESYEGAAVVGDNAFITPWLTAPHAEIRRRLDVYRDTAARHGHAGLREAGVFLMFCDRDHNAAVRLAKEVSTRYARHITSFRKGAALAGAGRSVQPDGSTADPRSALFSQMDFILSIADHIEERAIVGTPEECIRRIEEIDDELGLDRVLLYFRAGAMSIPEARRSMELFGNEVLPHFAPVAAVG